jgi:hypothetical protein
MKLTYLVPLAAGALVVSLVVYVVIRALEAIGNVAQVLA